MAVQWSGIHVSIAGSMSLIPGWELRSHTLWNRVKNIRLLLGGFRGPFLPVVIPLCTRPPHQTCRHWTSSWHLLWPMEREDVWGNDKAWIIPSWKPKNRHVLLLQPYWATFWERTKWSSCSARRRSQTYSLRRAGSVTPWPFRQSSLRTQMSCPRVEPSPPWFYHYCSEWSGEKQMQSECLPTGEGWRDHSTPIL